MSILKFFDDFRSFASVLSILRNFTDIFSAVSEYFSHKPLKFLCFLLKSRKNSGKILQKIEGEEEVEKMDALLSLAITGGDFDWI